MRAPQKVWDGAFGRQGLLLEIVMIKTNHGAGAKELRERSVDYAQARLWVAEESKGKGTGWQGWYSMKRFPRDLLRPWPGFWRPTLAHLFWRSYIVMTITLCQSLCSQTGHCETTYSSHLLFDLVSSILLCCFWSIQQCCFFAIDIHSSLICCYHAMPLPSVFSRLNT